MTHLDDHTFPKTNFDELTGDVFGRIPEMFRIFMKNAMNAEQDLDLQVDKYTQTQDSMGDANGYK